MWHQKEKEMEWGLRRKLTSQNKAKEAQKTTYVKALPSPCFAYYIDSDQSALLNSTQRVLLVTLGKWAEVNKRNH